MKPTTGDPGLSLRAGCGAYRMAATSWPPRGATARDFAPIAFPIWTALCGLRDNRRRVPPLVGAETTSLVIALLFAIGSALFTIGGVAATWPGSVPAPLGKHRY